MKRASIELKIAELESYSMRWLRLAGNLRRAGNYADAKTYVRVSRQFTPPKLVDRRIPLIAAE